MTEHAYYSECGAAVTGTYIWEDMAGNEVEVTIVGPPVKVNQIYTWADRKHVGVVKRFLRRGRPPEKSYTFDVGW